MEKIDKRKAKAVPPPDGRRRSYARNVNLEPEDYQKFYELSLFFDLNGTEIIRKLIREEYERRKDELDDAEQAEGGAT